ncbi:MAG: magnesium transporter [Rhodothermales bacterium]|nr:magnesium transporter [Rhodothermales bacterium]
MSEQPWKELIDLARQGSREQLDEFVNSLSAADIAWALERLDSEERREILAAMTPGAAADLIEEVPDVQSAELIEELDTSQAAAILNVLPSAYQADLVAALPAHRAEAVLAAMDPEEARDARLLGQYPPDVAGGIMVTEFLALPETWTIENVLDDLRRNAARYSDYDVQYAYVTSSTGRLVGVLRLRDVVLTRADRRVTDVMIENPLSVRVDSPLARLSEFFTEHPFFGVPVVDEKGTLVGVVKRAATLDAVADQQVEDHLKAVGIVGGEELRSMSVIVRSRRRLSWLSVNIILNIIAASVIAFFHETLAQVIALAVFLPIISDMSGCSGNQAVAVSLRELSLGVVRPFEIMHVAAKELFVGLMNGLVLGALISIAGWLYAGNVWLGAVVGAALAINTVVAVLIGGTVPLLLRRRGMDPALASGPILTTVTDMCGFFLALGLASVMIDRLVA